MACRLRGLRAGTPLHMYVGISHTAMHRNSSALDPAPGAPRLSQYIGKITCSASGRPRGGELSNTSPLPLTNPQAQMLNQLPATPPDAHHGHGVPPDMEAESRPCRRRVISSNTKPHRSMIKKACSWSLTTKSSMMILNGQSMDS